MSDHLTKAARSALMASVRSRGTAGERRVRKTLWQAGFRYRLNVRTLPGSPDIVLRRFNTVAFVQGCFWHGHCCRKGRSRPTSNQDYWNSKLDHNVARDNETQERLKGLGWNVFVIWECLLDEGTSDLLKHLEFMRTKYPREN